MSESFQEISQDFIPLEGVSLQIKFSEAYVGSSVVTPDPNSGVLLEGSVIQISESGVLSEPTTGNTVQITENSYVQGPDLTGINVVSAENYVAPQNMVTEKAQEKDGAREIEVVGGLSFPVENGNTPDMVTIDPTPAINEG